MSPPDIRSPEAIEAALLRYRIMAYIVGCMLIVLVFVGVTLQLAYNDLTVVNVVGPIHGTLYIIYLIAGADLARRGRWTLGQMIAVVCAGFLPFLAFFVEHRVTVRVRQEIAKAKSPGAPEKGTPGPR
jgi:integral membrane protein